MFSLYLLLRVVVRELVALAEMTTVFTDKMNLAINCMLYFVSIIVEPRGDVFR